MILNPSLSPGALNLTRFANQQSMEAENKALGTQVTLDSSKRDRKRTDNMLLHSASQFNLTLVSNDEMLEQLAMRLNGVKDSMPDLNEQV